MLLKGTKLKVHDILLSLNLFEQMTQLHDKKSIKFKNPSIRYNDYHKVFIPDKSKWSNSVEYMEYICFKALNQTSQSQY